MTLTEQEIAYLRRFWWEVFHQITATIRTLTSAQVTATTLAELGSTLRHLRSLR